MLCVLACWAVASGANGAAKSRVWKVSDVAGLLAAASEIRADGGLISIEPGEYELSEPLVFKARSIVNIVGSGWSTIIKRKGSGDAIVFEGSCWNCRVHGLTLQGNKDATNGSGIVFRKGEWSGICVVDYCHIDGFPEHGISFEGDPKKPFSSNTVSKCWLTNNRGDQLHSYYNNDFYFIGNQFGAGSGTYPKTGARLVENELLLNCKSPRPPFQYRNKGTMATIGRSAAVAKMGRFEFSGFPAWLAWLGVHLILLIGFRNKVAVLLQWAYAYCTYKRGARIITGLADNTKP